MNTYVIAVFAIIVGCVHGFAENAHLCDQILTVDCARHYKPGEKDEVVCASDNNTYQNYCEYGQARCRTPTTHIVYIGQCGATTVRTVQTTTQAATTTTQMRTTTQDDLMRIFCASKGAINCPTDLDPICGSDGNFYLNKCEFSKMTCDDPSLSAKDQQVCISG